MIRKFFRMSLMLVMLITSASLWAQVDPCNDVMGHLGSAHQVSNNKQGDITGTPWQYEQWSQGGNASMTYYDNGTYMANWAGSPDYMTRVGYRYDLSGIDHKTKCFYADYKYNKSGSAQYGYIGVYGWTQNPEVEFYIVDDWFAKPSEMYIGEKFGEIYVDGATYTIHAFLRQQEPSQSGTSTFLQIFSVRQTPRQCGHIDISAHFRKWDELFTGQTKTLRGSKGGGSIQLKFGKVTEVMLYAEAGGNATGSIDYTYFNMSDIKPIAYATLSDDNKTLTFRYGEHELSGSNEWNADDTGTTGHDWSQYASEITKVVFDESFAEARPLTCRAWFEGCENLTQIEGLENLNTSNTTTFDLMFNGCSRLTSLTIGKDFKVAANSTTDNMFQDCTGLKKGRLTITGTTLPSIDQDIFGAFDGGKLVTDIAPADLNVTGPDAEGRYSWKGGRFQNIFPPVSINKQTWENSSGKIATWEGNRKGAVTFTFDDGAPCHVNDVGPLFKKYGYKATFFLVCCWNPNWSGFHGLADEGHEIASHSNTHTMNMSDGEIESSKMTINRLIKQPYGCITLAYPNNVPNESLVMQNYIAGRRFNGSWFGQPDFMTKDGPSNWAQCPALMTGTEGTVKYTNDFKSQMNNAIVKNGWVMFVTHGLQGKTNGNATYSPTDIGAIEGALKWAQQNDNDIWVTPFRNAVMYIKERKASSLQLIGQKANSLTYTLTHTIADNICSYNYPLTLLITAEQDDDYDYVITQDGKVIEEVTTDGNTFMFQAVPNGGDIVLTRIPHVDLADNTDNEAIIQDVIDYYDKTANVGLKGRTFYRDGEWNTICLPFDVPLKGSPLEGATAMKLNTEKSSLDNGILSLYFDDEKESLSAGTPYIIKWNAEKSDIVDPEFKCVTFSNEMHDACTDDNTVSFCGTYSKYSFGAENKSILFLGTKNKLYYPQPGLDDAKTTVTYPSIAPFRAFFRLNDELNLKSKESPVKEFRLNFGEDSETPLLSPEGEDIATSPRGGLEGVIYDLSGRKMFNGQCSMFNGLPKGLYIVNGKKILK